MFIRASNRLLHSRLAALSHGDQIPDLFDDVEAGALEQPAALRLVNEEALDLQTLFLEAGRDTALQLELFSAARRGCGGAEPGEGCEPILSTSTQLSYDRMSAAGDRACGQIDPPWARVRSGEYRRARAAKVHRWCTLRGASFVLPELRNGSDLAAPVRNWAPPQPLSDNGLNSGELFSTLGTVNLPPSDRAAALAATLPPLAFSEGDNMYTFGRGWDSAPLFLGQTGHHRPQRPASRFDIVVRCADDPYVLAAHATGLSMDFGLTEAKLHACALPYVPCAHFCDQGLLLMLPLFLMVCCGCCGICVREHERSGRECCCSTLRLRLASCCGSRSATRDLAVRQSRGAREAGRDEAAAARGAGRGWMERAVGVALENPPTASRGVPAAMLESMVVTLPALADGGPEAPHPQQLCSICLGGLAADGEAKAPEARLLRLPCGHLFHYDCGLQWLGAHESCPECRALVSAPEQQQQQPGTPPQLAEGAP